MNTEREDWARYFMWERILGKDNTRAHRTAYAKEESAKLGEITHPSDVLPLMQDYQKAEDKMQVNHVLWQDCEVYTNKFNVAPTPIYIEEEYPMYTEIQGQRSYLHDRLYIIEEGQIHKLRQHFHLQDDDAPTTPKEIVERIKAGRYVIPEKFDSWTAPYYAFRWRDPEAVKDQEGFEAAFSKLKAASQAVKDIIAIRPVEEGLKALNEFESATFH